MKSSIDAVRIYRRGATITRKLVIPAPVPGEIEIEDLPLALVDATIRVRSPDVDVTSFRVGLWVPPRGPAPEPPELEAIRTVEERIERNNHALAHVRAEIGVLEGINVPHRPEGEAGKPPPAAPLTGRLMLEELVDDAVRSRIEEVTALERELRSDRLVLQDLQEKWARASSAKTARSDELKKVVIANVTSTKAESVTLTIEYFVQGARWAPAYQCRLDAEGKAAELEQRAMVCQRTGEDWLGVKLSLSTASPMRWAELPSLASIRIGKAQPELPVRAPRPPPRGAKALYGDYDSGYSNARGLLPDVSRASMPALGAPSLDLISTPQFTPPPPPAPVPPPAPRAARPTAASYGAGGSAMVSMDMMDDEAGVTEDADEVSIVSAKAREVYEEASPERSRRDVAKPKKQKKSRKADADTLESIVYASLTLPDPSSSNRNKLVPIDAMESYREILGRAGVPVEGDIESSLYGWNVVANAVADVALPAGAIDVGSLEMDFDYTYITDARVDVESDGVFHSVPIGTRAGPCDMRYVVVPREDSNVFRVATLTNPTAAPLLPGPADIFVGGDFVLATNLPAVPAHGQFSLGLGVDQAIRCTRNSHFREARSGDKVVATTELWHEITIELANGLGREIACEVRERIPVPAPDAEVVVEEGTITPVWETYEQDERQSPIEGGRRWQARVGAHSTTTLIAEYVVKIYANNELVGGNRRER